MNLFKTFFLACLLAVIAPAATVQAASSSNTIVRIEYRHGQTVWATMDVELFDTLKPLTVSNFLYYVRNGSYDRTFLHRVVPNFIIQSGQYTVQNPYAQSPANYLNRIPEGPPIASEAITPPVLPNTFGTIAMALTTTNRGNRSFPNRNSATTSWFINTEDNTEDLPEYTVFGKVISGAKYLTYFNSIGENFGLINMFGISYLFSNCDLLTIDDQTNTGLASIPVFYWYFDCPFYSDLFNLQLSIIKSVADGSDKKAPQLKIVHPSANTVITNDSITLTGTVSGVSGTNSVRVFHGSNQPVAATITGTTWSATLSGLPAGTNSVLVDATDDAGNRTTISTRFFFKVPWPLTILPSSGTGTGDVYGLTNGQPLNIGQIYSISARPDPRNFFITWAKSNVNVTTSLNYRFFMETGMTINAQFETNLYPHIKGTYQGLFVNTNTLEQHNSGYLTLSLSDVGAYSGKLYFSGKTIPVSGSFPQIPSTETVTTKFLAEVPGYTVMRLSLNLLNPDNKITGWMTNVDVSKIYVTTNYVLTNIVVTNLVETNLVATNLMVITTNNVGWSNSLTADRVVFNARANPAPQAGEYTVIFPADTNSTPGPAGDGYGTVTVNTGGAITFAGVLADGTKVTQKTFLSQDGYWPLYVPLYETNGSLISWVNFSDEETTDFSGLLNWFKRTDTAKYFASGFTNEATLLGSRFTPPNNVNPMLYLTNAVVGFTNGNLTADFANDVTINPKGKVTNLGDNALSLSINSRNGLISGSVSQPGNGQSVSFKGAILQKGTNAAGFFLGTNASGSVRLGR